MRERSTSGERYISEVTVTDPTLDDLSAFLHRYRRFSAGLSAQRLQNFKRRFGHLKAGFSAVQSSGRELERHTAGRFNLFRLLGVERAEAPTHSRLLAHLLDPAAGHGQGTLFLRGFLAMLAAKDPALGEVLPTADERWTVATEFSAGAYGRLDILLQRAVSPKAAIVIENKVYSVLSDGQLQRYADWLARFRPQPWRTHLVFLSLSPTGVRPEGVDCPDRPLICLNYRHDIHHWLRKALTDIPSVRLLESLQQYLDVIVDL